MGDTFSLRPGMKEDEPKEKRTNELQILDSEAKKSKSTNNKETLKVKINNTYKQESLDQSISVKYSTNNKLNNEKNINVSFHTTLNKVPVKTNASIDPGKVKSVQTLEQKKNAFLDEGIKKDVNKT